MVKRLLRHFLIQTFLLFLFLHYVYRIFAIKIVTNKETIDPKTAGNSGPKNFATRT